MMSMRLNLVTVAVAVALAVATAATVALAAPPPGMVPMAAPTTAPQPESSITLYEKPNFQGRSITFDHRVASLNAVGFNDLAQSVKITGKRDWVLCEGRNFLGRCIRVREKEKDLKRQKFTSLASSIYPVQ